MRLLMRSEPAGVGLIGGGAYVSASIPGVHVAVHEPLAVNG